MTTYSAIDGLPTSAAVRSVCGFSVVRQGAESTLAAFRDGRCVESGFPNFNEARLWCIRNRPAPEAVTP